MILEDSNLNMETLYNYLWGIRTLDPPKCSVRLILCSELHEVLWKEAREIYDVISMLKEFITSMWRPDKHKKHLQSTSTLNCLALTRMVIFSSSLLFIATCRGFQNSRGVQGRSPEHGDSRSHSAV